MVTGMVEELTSVIVAVPVDVAMDETVRVFETV